MVTELTLPKGPQEEVQAYLQRLSGTTLDAQGAAAAWAGVAGRDLVGSLNAKGGTTGREFLGALSSVVESAAITDSFSEANGTNLHGKATTTGGKTWTVRNGTMDVSGGLARVTAGSGSSWATIDAGYSNFDMSVTITYAAAVIDGLIFRVVDANNYLRLSIDTNNNRLEMIRNIAGTESNIALSGDIPNLDPGQTATFRALCVGTSIKIYTGATLRIDTIDATHQTATNHGIIGFNTGTRFDNFSIEAVA